MAFNLFQVEAVNISDPPSATNEDLINPSDAAADAGIKEISYNYSMNIRRFLIQMSL